MLRYFNKGERVIHDGVTREVVLETPDVTGTIVLCSGGAYYLASQHVLCLAPKTYTWGGVEWEECAPGSVAPYQGPVWSRPGKGVFIYCAPTDPGPNFIPVKPVRVL